MDFIKKNKVKLIYLSIILVMFIFAFVSMKELLYPNYQKDLYGNRLKGIKDVLISDDKVSKIEHELKQTDKVSGSNYALEGRLMSFMIDVKADIKRKDAIKLVDVILNNFTQKEKEYYDIQVYITCKSTKDKTEYPVIGYKHKTSTEFKWTNN